MAGRSDIDPVLGCPTSLVTANPTDEELAVYAYKVFELANRERQKAGLDEVSWDDDFAAYARIRAEELQYRYSHYRPVKPTAGREKWPVLTHEFIVINNQAASDRAELAKLLNISSEQLEYVTNAEAGSGLMRIGHAIVPFVNKFNPNSSLYRLMSTKPGEQ